jgi:hypothetical protein
MHEGRAVHDRITANHPRYLFYGCWRSRVVTYCTVFLYLRSHQKGDACVIIYRLPHYRKRIEKTLIAFCNGHLLTPARHKVYCSDRGYYQVVSTECSGHFSCIAISFHIYLQYFWRDVKAWTDLKAYLWKRVKPGKIERWFAAIKSSQTGIA